MHLPLSTVAHAKNEYTGAALLSGEKDGAGRRVVRKRTKASVAAVPKSGGARAAPAQHSASARILLDVFRRAARCANDRMPLASKLGAHAVTRPSASGGRPWQGCATIRPSLRQRDGLRRCASARRCRLCPRADAPPGKAPDGAGFGPPPPAPVHRRSPAAESAGPALQAAGAAPSRFTPGRLTSNRAPIK